MATALQNRLIGTVIIVALAVIFLPDFLDGKKITNEEVFIEVPTPPIKKALLNPEPFPQDRVERAVTKPTTIVEEIPVDDTNISTNNSTVVNATEDATNNDLASQTVIENTSDRVNEGVGWVIQLGSFRHQKNVEQLLKTLEKAGYRAFSRPIQTSSGPLTKVFVGPDLEKNKLEQALPHLTEITELKGKITEFRVN